MHVSPAKHSSGKCDRRTDRRTDDGQSDPYVSLCFAGDTKRRSQTKVAMDPGLGYFLNNQLLSSFGTLTEFEHTIDLETVHMVKVKINFLTYAQSSFRSTYMLTSKTLRK